MTTYDEQSKKIKDSHEAVMAQMNKVHDASKRFIENSSAQADELIKSGKYQEATEVMLHMADGIEAKNKIIAEAHVQSADNFSKAFNVSSKSSSKVPEAVLPKGISKGKMAAIAAGVAVIGGGIILYRQHQQKKQEPWASRIQQERLVSGQRGLSY